MMKKTLLTAALVASGLLGAVAAEAATYSAGTLSPTPQTATEFVGVGSFADILNFSVASPYLLVTGSVMDVPVGSFYDITGMQVFLYGGFGAKGPLLASDTAGPDYHTRSVLFAPGDYSLKLTGTGAGSWGGMYTATLVAVPEPGEWALMLSGLGLVGLMARRRNRA